MDIANKKSPGKPDSFRKAPSNPSAEFAPVLRRVCITAWLLKLIPIPIGLWNAWLLSRIVTCAVAGDSESVLKNGAALLLLLTLTKLFDFVTEQSYGKAVSRALQNCKQLLYRRFLACPLSALYGMEHGQAVELMNDDFNTVTGKSLTLYPGFFTGLASFAAYFAFLLVQNPPAALALLGISLLQAVPPFVVKGFLEKNYSDTRDIEAKITNCTMEYYHGFDTIKIFELKQWCLDRLARLHKKYLRIGNRSEAAATAENSLDKLIENILTYGTYGLMGLFILKGYTELGTGVEAIALSGGLYAAAKSLFDTIPSFAVAKTAEGRMAVLYEDVDAPDYANHVFPHGSTAEKYFPADREESCIRLDGVSCGFDKRQLLSDVHICIPNDQISVIKGANGTGKSTLLKLILGMVRPSGGKVSINGIPSISLPRDLFPESLFYLPQEDAAFHISAEELYSCAPGCKEDAARAFAARFSLTEEALRQPIDTLSGGQRKKVFLAFAFAVNPDLMLLDEPCNSLDTEARDTLVLLLKERSGGAAIVTHDNVFDGIADVFYTVQNSSGHGQITLAHHGCSAMPKSPGI